MKRSRNTLTLFSLSILIALFSSCIKTYKIPRTEVPQLQKKDLSDGTRKQYIRTVMAFDEYQKKAHFDILWLSDEMCTMYARLHAQHYGKDTKEQEAMLQSLLKENKRIITCYILVELARKESVIDDEQSFWTTYLETEDGRKASPQTLKEVDLDPIVESILSHRYTGHKIPYKVTFPAHDLTGKPYVTDDHPLRLVMSSPYGSVVASFVHHAKEKKRCGASRYMKTTQKDETLDDEDFYWV